VDVRRLRLGVVAWKVLLYLVVAVVLAGLTRDLALTAVLTVAFALGDGSVAAVLRRPADEEPPPRRTPAPEAAVLDPHS
jgi:hypothetical protein